MFKRRLDSENSCHKLFYTGNAMPCQSGSIIWVVNILVNLLKEIRVYYDALTSIFWKKMAHSIMQNDHFPGIAIYSA